ncbi:helix-turn-helix transcriptional regulator [Anaeromyxobacter terrae]|uniref:helix-turn-helix transcriptional regulator n=1 Tax=Anaeromyxobacter terrae TaxID=2925406 RepID=UPI001F59ED98|nr:helix-turn-helix transcriptional regulator [Anaeromyxobacter sp. SG22]
MKHLVRSPAADDALVRPAVLAVPAAILLVVALLVGLDVVSDARAGGTTAHLLLEVAVMAAALSGTVLLWGQLLLARRRARDLQLDLGRARADLAGFRAEADAYVRGLGAAIDHQFTRWGLSAAEREVALLLLKGLASKEIAQVRGTSERTARQQALAIYRKAGLAGRAELAAFFLEDLLSPPAAPAREGVREGEGGGL